MIRCIYVSPPKKQMPKVNSDNDDDYDDDNDVGDGGDGGGDNWGVSSSGLSWFNVGHCWNRKWPLFAHLKPP